MSRLKQLDLQEITKEEKRDVGLEVSSDEEEEEEEDGEVAVNVGGGNGHGITGKFYLLCI